MGSRIRGIYIQIITNLSWTATEKITYITNRERKIYRERVSEWGREREAESEREWDREWDRESNIWNQIVASLLK